jgi:hypothetical protein
LGICKLAEKIQANKYNLLKYVKERRLYVFEINPGTKNQMGGKTYGELGRGGKKIGPKQSRRIVA